MEQEVKEIKTIKITEKGQICIPREAREMAGFKEGAKINLIVYDDKVELRPMKKGISEAMIGYIMSEEALSKNWDNPEEDEAWKHL